MIYSAALNKMQKGYVTDNFIINRNGTAPLLSSPSLPKDLTQSDKKDDKNTEKTLLKMVGVPLAILGAGALITAGLAKMFRNKIPKEFTQKLSKKMPVGDMPPNIGTNTNLLTESELATYRFIREPKIKTLFGALAVFTFSAGTFVLKNTVDGIKEIWVKQKKANIKRNYQEGMIAIENRSFSGKKQIIRYMLNKNEVELNNFNKINNISFTGNKEKTEKDKKPEQSKIKPVHVLLGAVAIAGSVLLMALSIKNIRKIGKDINNSAKSIKEKLVNSLKNLDENKINEDELVQQLIKTDTTKPEQVEKVFKETNFSKEFRKKITEKVTSTYAQTHPSQGIDGKRTIFSIVNDASGFLYDFIVNPNIYSGALFAGLASVTGLGYVGSRTIEANKEVQVEKAGADIDLDMHDKLVKVELKNFMTKKESAVNPLIRDYKDYAKNPEPSKEVLKSTYNTIFDEIKNGPPFVYD